MGKALKKIIDVGWVVQRWVKFNAWLTKIYGSNCFSKEKIMVFRKFS